MQEFVVLVCTKQTVWGIQGTIHTHNKDWTEEICRACIWRRSEIWSGAVLGVYGTQDKAVCAEFPYVATSQIKVRQCLQWEKILQVNATTCSFVLCWNAKVFLRVLLKQSSAMCRSVYKVQSYLDQPEHIPKGCYDCHGVRTTEWKLRGISNIQKIITKYFLIFHVSTAPIAIRRSYRGFTITLRHTTPCRALLDKCATPSQMSPLNNTQNSKQIFMVLAGFEPAIPASEQP